MEAHTKAEASRATETRPKLKTDQEAYRANLLKVFNRELAVSSREKALAQREETFALEVVSFAAQWSDLSFDRASAAREASAFVCASRRVCQSERR